MARQYSNTSVETTLAAGIGAGGVSLTVASATGYPAVPFAVVIDPGIAGVEEVVLVTAKAGTTFTITRAYDGTAAIAHSAGATIIHAAIADDFRGSQLGTRDVATTAPSSGQALVWDGSAWGPGSPAGTLTKLAGEALGGHRAVWIDADDRAYYADNTAAHGERVVGVTTGAASIGASATIQIAGEIIEPSWAWTPGPVWLSTTGQITQTPPVAGTLVPLGIATAPTKLMLDIKAAVLR